MLNHEITPRLRLFDRNNLSKVFVAGLVMFSICICKIENCSALSIPVLKFKKYNNPVLFESVRDEVIETAKRHGFQPFLIKFEHTYGDISNSQGVPSKAIFVEYNIQFIKHDNSEDLKTPILAQVAMTYEISDALVSGKIRNEIKCRFSIPITKASQNEYSIAVQEKFIALNQNDSTCKAIIEKVNLMSGGVE